MVGLTDPYRGSSPSQGDRGRRREGRGRGEAIAAVARIGHVPRRPADAHLRLGQRRARPEEGAAELLRAGRGRGRRMTEGGCPLSPQTPLELQPRGPRWRYRRPGRDRRPGTGGGGVRLRGSTFDGYCGRKHLRAAGMEEPHFGSLHEGRARPACRGPTARGRGRAGKVPVIHQGPRGDLTFGERGAYPPRGRITSGSPRSGADGGPVRTGKALLRPPGGGRLYASKTTWRVFVGQARAGPRGWLSD